MSEYDFTHLSPIEFEELSRDLLQKHLKIYLENFASGRDEGIDLRFCRDKKRRQTIIQCKRYQTFDNLKSSLKKEVQKAIKLKPRRYILVTSVSLTPNRKQEIMEIYNGLIKEPADIFGRENLNNLLGQFPEIERKHIKLWLSSIEVMEKILHSNIINRSEFVKEEIFKNIRTYVPNNSFKEALKLLNKYNYVLISGIPGIGKSTLAKMLIYKYLSNDYEVVEVSNDIDEAERVFIKGRKQVFYYDDFLGSNFLNTNLNKNEEKRLIRFISKIRNDSNKKLIMTTREYILVQARERYESLDTPNLDLVKCIVDIEKYSLWIKARILYNHLWFSEIPQEYIRSLLEDENYYEIIEHRNYSPRVIDFMTYNLDSAYISSENYYKIFIQNLDNPVEIWKHAFQNQISESSRYVLFTLLTLSGKVYSDDLKKCFYSLVEYDTNTFKLQFNRETFNNSLKELENSFIKIEKDSHGNLYINFQNPSIQDFLINILKKDNDLKGSLLNSLIFIEQITNIFHVKTTKTKKVLLDDRLEKILEEVIIKGFDNFKYINRANDEDEVSWFFNYKRNKSVWQKLLDIANFFDLNKNIRIVKFIVKKIDELKPKSDYLETYVDLLIKITPLVELDKVSILSDFFQSITTIKDALAFKSLKTILPTSYDKFIKDNFQEVSEKLETIVNENINSDKEIEDEINEIIYILSGLESEYGLDFYDQTRLLEEKLISLRSQNQNEEIEYTYEEDVDESYTDEQIFERIYDLFESLRLK